MEIRVLGPVELSAEGQRLEIGAAKQRAVLAMLVLEPNAPVSQERLIDELWGGRVPASAVGSLHSYIYRLRKLLTYESGAVSLRRDVDGYALSVPPEAVDLHRFERLAASGRTALEDGKPSAAVDDLRAALALWRGEAFHSIDTPTVQARARALHEAWLAAYECCLAAELERGRHEPIVTELERLTNDHPFRERLWELLMTALERSGRRADALAAYRRLYRILDEELGIQPSESVRQLHQRILTGDSTQHPEPAQPDTTHPVQPVPRQLPPRLRDFVGRVGSLERLGDPANQLVVALTGPAGIGKTTLALQWAHQVAGRFPDGQLYVNLRGFDAAGAPVAPAHAARGFLDALGVPSERIPAEADAQVGLYRGLLARRRILVLLDNARDSEQVRSLLPTGPGCLAVVTSRDQLTGLVAAHGARLVPVDLLDSDEARRLVASRVGAERVDAEPAAVDDIVSACGRLPLALAIVAARAAVTPQLPLSHLSAELVDAGTGLDAFSADDDATDLRAVFSWSYARLGDEAARVLRLLGLHSGPDISAPAAASLAAVPPADIHRPLRELTRAHLLSEHRPGRYTFHDLLRAYATELTHAHDSTEDRHQATHRLLDHYLHSAHTAAMLLKPHRERISLGAAEPGVTPEDLSDHGDAMAWLASERSVLLAGLQDAATNGFDTHAWQLAWALADYLDRMGRCQDLVDSHRAAQRAASRLEPAIQARVLRDLARAYMRSGRRNEASAHLQQSMELCHQAGDTAGQANAHRSLASLLAGQGRHDEAIHHAEQAVQLYGAVQDRVGLALALNGLGWYHARLGNHGLATDYCRQGLELFQEIGHRHGAAATSDSLAYAHHHLGQHDEAARYYQQALALFRDLADRYEEASTLLRLGEMRHATGDRDAASVCWRQALEILDELGHPDADQVRAKIDQFDSPDHYSSRRRD